MRQNKLGIDTILFDYGGVLGTHRVEPYWSQMAQLLNADPKDANKFLLETSAHGIAFRLGEMNTLEFWNEVQRLAGVSGRDCHVLMDNWARSYAMDPQMVDLSSVLRSYGYKTGILMNSDAERYKYIQNTYDINKYFDFIISSNIHHVTKPDKKAYEVAKEIVNKVQNPHSVLYIDDRSVNADVGVECGMQGYTFKDYSTLLEWLMENEFIENNRGAWVNELYEREKKLIYKFFGYNLPIKSLPLDITEEKYKLWSGLDMQLHYLPDIDLDRKLDFPGWKFKPYEWFYERIEAGDVLEISGNGDILQVDQPMNLGGRWILIDGREKPNDNNGVAYEDDFLGDAISRMRNDGILDKNISLDDRTRFFTSWTEFDEKIRPVVADMLGVRTEQVRLPRVVEYNYIGNLLHPEWGETDTWEWLQEACGGGKYRMRAGHSFAGGLSIIYWRGPAGHGTDRGFRPVVDFGI